MAEATQGFDRGLTVGERLRAAREAEGLTLDDVATRTRIPTRHLRNIEQSNWDELPAVTYTVGFGRSYANAVGLDGNEIGRELREQLGGTARPQQVSPEFYSPADPARVPSRPLAWAAGIILVLLVAGYLFWRSTLTETEDAQIATVPVQEGTPQQAAQQPQPVQPADLTGQPVLLRATGEVWFRVRNRAGELQIQDRTLAAGEEYRVPAEYEQPVLRTGRPQNLRVVIGGRDFGPLAAEERTVSDVSLRAADLAASLQPQQAPQPPQPAGAASTGTR